MTDSVFIATVMRAVTDNDIVLLWS